MECLNRYEAVAVTQKAALNSQIINVFEGDEVYNKIGKDGKLKMLQDPMGVKWLSYVCS